MRSYKCDACGKESIGNVPITLPIPEHLSKRKCYKTFFEPIKYIDMCDKCWDEFLEAGLKKVGMNNNV